MLAYRLNISFVAKSIKSIFVPLSGLRILRCGHNKTFNNLSYLRALEQCGASIPAPCVWVSGAACSRGHLLSLDRGLLLCPLRCSLVSAYELAKVFADGAVGVTGNTI